MPTQAESPYAVHVFVCTNDRHGEKPSCADHQSERVKAELKEAVAKRGWKGKVRVSTSGCMGLCGSGPNVMIHPQKIWFSGVALTDVDKIMAAIEAALAERVGPATP